MDNIEKKSRRPRIGESRNISVVSTEGNSDITPRQTESESSERGEQQERSYGNSGYQQRSYRPGNNNGPRQYSNQNRQNGYNQGYGRQGGYNNNNRYGNQGGYGGNRYNNNNQYGNQGYSPRHNRYETSEVAEPTATDATSHAEGFNPAEGENNQTGYQPRQQYQNYNNNRQQGGYNNNRQGGYNNRYGNQGGYNNNRQGGYNNNNRYGNQGGYNNRPRTESYNNNTGAEGSEEENTQQHNNNGYQPRQPRFNNNRQQGGYNNNRQGGYNNNRQGGYQNRQQGGYNNNRQGGYNNGNNRRPGGNQRNQFGMPQGGKSFTPRPRPVIYEETAPAPDEQIRLNKYMANAGLCSRREADEFIKQGLVKVNGEVVTELGTKITPQDTIEYDDKVVTLERKCYILLNKPKDCVTTSDDPNGRLTVMDIVKGACNERIYPVGRLDRNTTGVLLLTNDGDLASKLTHPKYVKKKIYHVWTDKDIAEEDMQRIADGIELEDGPIHADAISYATETDRNQAGIEIHSGRNRIVRRIFESLGYHVTKLDRVYFAGLTKKNLPRGRWRYLTQEEVNYLKMGSFE
ncbi:MAG: pseudouridine synthase [Barnesiella sp.]|nr:pseudouridine synthase [Barnesiella sp.]MBD5345175.1 pseudouridine synthase [Bacteroides sp.]